MTGAVGLLSFDSDPAYAQVETSTWHSYFYCASGGRDCVGCEPYDSCSESFEAIEPGGDVMEIAVFGHGGQHGCLIARAADDCYWTPTGFWCAYIANGCGANKRPSCIRNGTGQVVPGPCVNGGNVACDDCS